VRQEQRGIPGTSEPRRDHDGPWFAVRAISSGTCGTWGCRAFDNLNQLIPLRFTRRTGPGTSTTTSQALLVAAHLFGRPQGVDRVGRRTGPRRQVRDGFSTGPRGQRPADPRARWPGGREPGAAAVGDAGVVRQPCRLSDGDRPAGRASGALFSVQQPVGWGTTKPIAAWSSSAGSCSNTRWIGIISMISRSRPSRCWRAGGSRISVAALPGHCGPLHVRHPAGLSRFVFRPFVKSGGKVIFVATHQNCRGPRHSSTPRCAGRQLATLIEPSGDITPRVIAGAAQAGREAGRRVSEADLPARSWRDAEMYFFFNESNRRNRRIPPSPGAARRKPGIWPR